MTDKNSSNSSEIFCCNICDYYSSKQSQYTRHLLTHKHKILTNTDIVGSAKEVFLTNIYKIFIKN